MTHFPPRLARERLALRRGITMVGLADVLDELGLVPPAPAS
jgi:hypothetical protein